MALSVGDRIGPYEIVAPLGAGGMGEVWKARDTRLDRVVAIKASQERFSDRFEREARAIGALNHPHICTLYDVGPDYLVMELVEGETLAARLKKGKLSIELAMEYGAQIAQALAEAHSKGITHRDLKPSNIMLTKSGVKVLDFGLAKSAHDETLTLTNALVGTPAYMAPEQLEGKPCDARADIYALGLVLYEMATGESAHPDRPLALDGLPERFAHIVRRSLARDPDDRWQAARDVGAELAWACEPERGTSHTPRARLWWALTTAGLAAAALGLWAGAHYRSPAPNDRVLRLQIDPPETGQIPLQPNLGGIALSPDGTMAAYVASVNGKTGLWVRSLDTAAARLLPGTEAAQYPFWSPDSRSIAFFNTAHLLRIEVAGGSPQTICATLGVGGGGAWSSDEQIVFGLINSVLFRVPASGGTPSRLTTLDSSRGEIEHSWPQILPGGRLLYWVRSNKPGETGVYAASLDKPAQKVKLLNSEANALYTTAGDGRGYLLWLRGETLVAQEFEPGTLRLAGEQHPLASPVSNVVSMGRLNATVGGGGLLMYSAYGTTRSQFTWFDRNGKPLGALGDADDYNTFRLSSDGRRVVASRDRSGGTDLFLLDTATRLSTRFTINSSVNVFPIWSPNGRTVLFSATFNLSRADADRAGSEEPVIPPQTNKFATDWSGDGRIVLYWEVSPDSGSDLGVLRVSPDGRVAPGAAPTVYLSTPSNEGYGRFSPEPTPRWVAYQSDESGQYEIYIAAFPDYRNKVRVSTGGGSYPQWNSNGREVFFVAPGNRLTAVALEREADSIRPSAPHELFVLPIVDGGFIPFEVARDGQQFLVRATAHGGSQPLTLIVNWPALLRKPSP